MARAEDAELEHAQALQAGEVGRERAGPGRDEDAAGAEHRVARAARAARDEREVVGRVAVHGHGEQRAEALAVSKPRVGVLEGRGGDRHAARRVAQAHGEVGVVGVVVGQRDAADPAAVAGVGEDALQVGVEVGAGVDDPARVPPHEPCVRALQREGTGVVRDDEPDVVHVSAGRPGGTPAR